MKRFIRKVALYMGYIFMIIGWLVATIAAIPLVIGWLIKDSLGNSNE